MATITLAEAKKYGNDEIVAGVIDSIIEVDHMFRSLPFHPVEGNSLRYNQEVTMGDVQTLAIGGTVTAKAPSSVVSKNANLITILGQSEVNGLILAQNVGENGGNMAIATQLASKAKNVGRKFQELLITGNSATDPTQFDGLAKLLADGPASQLIAAGGPLSFEKLDELLHAVKSKDGHVDALVMSSADIRALRALFRALGGSSGEYVEVNGIQYPSYAGVPILRNEWVKASASPATTEVYAVNFDDGSGKVGISGLNANVGTAGLVVSELGEDFNADNEVNRIKFYCGFALFSQLGAAKLTGVTQ